MLQVQNRELARKLPEQITDESRSVRAAHDRSLQEEPLFLDEPADYQRHARGGESASAMDLFADENDLRNRTAWVGTGIRSGTPAHAVAAATFPGFPRVRPTLLAGMSLLAALTALATVRACEAHGAQALALLPLVR